MTIRKMKDNENFHCIHCLKEVDEEQALHFMILEPSIGQSPIIVMCLTCMVKLGQGDDDNTKKMLAAMRAKVDLIVDEMTKARKIAEERALVN